MLQVFVKIFNGPITNISITLLFYHMIILGYVMIKLVMVLVSLAIVFPHKKKKFREPMRGNLKLFSKFVYGERRRKEGLKLVLRCLEYKLLGGE